MNKKKHYENNEKRRLLVAFFFFLSSYANDELDNDGGLQLVLKGNSNHTITTIQKQPEYFQVSRQYHENKSTERRKVSSCQLCCILAILSIDRCGPCILCLCG